MAKMTNYTPTQFMHKIFLALLISFNSSAFAGPTNYGNATVQKSQPFMMVIPSEQPLKAGLH